MDQMFERHGMHSMRPTIINIGDVWTKQEYPNLSLSTSEGGGGRTVQLNGSSQLQEKNRAYDLLDGLTKSGAITVEDVDIHVIVSTTHCFDLSLMDTVVQRNVNPIERVHETGLLLASVIHQCVPEDMVCYRPPGSIDRG
jgi:hypothetical protein